MSGEGEPAAPHLLDALDALAERFRTREPEISAFVPEEGRFERLRREAGRLIERFPEPSARPPLFGLPLGVKDVFHVAGLPTGGGSRLPPDELAGPEARAVAALKEAGALIVGKTVSTEFAYFAPGPTRNPHAPEHTPGGSSSGSAAAVAAGLATLALGTQTIGSVGRPAAYCGVVGYKPTYGRISRDGLIPLSPSLDHVGLFAADVAGVVPAAELLAGAAVRQSPSPPVLGVPEGPYLERASDQGRDHFRAVCRRLREGGLRVQAVPAMADFAEIEARHHRIVAAEAAAVHRQWFDRHGDLYHAKTADLIRRGREIDDDTLAGDLERRGALAPELTSRMDRHGVDLWISPAAPGPAPRGLDSTGDPVMNLPWTHSGLPTLVLPAGRTGAGLPLGLQLAARSGRDSDLLAWGRQIETRLA